jgi:hypothetical protein
MLGADGGFRLWLYPPYEQRYLIAIGREESQAKPANQAIK